MPDPIEAYGAPASEMSEDFVDGMRKRMAMSYFKYGLAADGYADGSVDALASMEARLDRYRATGNTEWLIDAANFAMLEFMFPQHPDAEYRATDSGESPGRVVHTDAPGADTRRSSKHNLDILPRGRF